MNFRNLSTKLGVGAGVAALALLTVGGTAFASTPTPTESATITGGSLSVTPTGNGSVTATLGQNVSATGTLPPATWDDSTGTGDGWTGSIEATALNYTGTWSTAAPAGSGVSMTALTTDTSAPFTGSADGITYTVAVTGSGTFTYTSNDPSDASGSGTFTAGSPATVGKYGLTITIQSGIGKGNSYVLNCGTQNASSLTIPSSGTTITPVSTTSPSPFFIGGNETIETGNGSGGYGSAAPLLSAGVDTGMGAYNVNPAVKFTPDNNSWASTYTSDVLYSIASGPYVPQETNAMG